MEAFDDGRPLALGGTKQKATLGYLLLQADRAVATSQLLHALWPVGEAPVSARKVLQNAVWGLRRALSTPGPPDGTPALVTQPPGYKLRVDPDDIDFFRFRSRVEAGRTRLAAGEPERAALTLRGALSLWRGPLLADVVEAGISWPELTTAQNARWDAMEDYFEAELACGRHLAVLGELEAMVEGMALRERSCGQLMLALYRGGRQSDALHVYSRVRTALVERLGLEPGRDLRSLQQAILAHDPALMLPGADACRPGRTGAELTAAPRASAPPREETVPSQRQPEDGDRWTVYGVPAPGAESGAREWVSTLLVQSRFAEGAAGGRGAEADDLLDDIAARVRDTAERFGGAVSATLGSVTVLLFGNKAERQGSAERAVLAGLAIADELRSGAGALPPGVSVRASVGTGEVLVRSRLADGAPLTFSGVLLGRAHALLFHAGDDEIRVCDETRRATTSLVGHRLDDTTGEWIVDGALGEESLPTVEREFELGLVRQLVELARHRSTSHLVTVLGDAGTGKSRFLTEVGRKVADRSCLARFQVPEAASDPAAATASEPVPSEVHALECAMVNALCGILPGDSRQLATDKLLSSFRRLVDHDTEGQVGWLKECLIPFVDPGAGPVPPKDTAVEIDEWRRFLEQPELGNPLVLVIDDLHRADDELLEFIDGLTDLWWVPLIVIASARPQLLHRRPGWGGGKRHATTITLEALSDAAVDELADFLLLPALSERKGPARCHPARVSGVPVEKPDERRRYVRALLSMGAPRRIVRSSDRVAAPEPLLSPSSGR
ncbi:AAA family ATPase [Streptomyces sp. SID4919]|uniref:BTAD domain-containing putative transcriptional regulator n=1 Tax=unclassified Streptomyces TaxID=2593676 RepID=UPI000C06CDA6|nr:MULTISPECIES: BTAD domain-containing putative transcriptional regulator [unclassified Streptomyces]MYY10685.1 AAA family ATPase [Streptomyces sp. SID4919]